MFLLTDFEFVCALLLASKWLNTCIGSANYNYFLGVVFSVSVLTSESIALSLALMVPNLDLLMPLSVRSARCNIESI